MKTSSWNHGLAVVERWSMPSPYTLSQMSREDVPELLERLPRWYPAIRVGLESPHLLASFYLRETQLKEVMEERSLLPLVIRHPQDGLVALSTFEHNALGRSIKCRVGVLAPEHRQSGLALIGPMLLEDLGRAIGAELAYYYATLQTRHQQVIAERRGFQLVGIVPGHDLSALEDGQVKRAYEALYAKVLVPNDQLHVPPVESLTSRTRAVCTALFDAGPTDLT